MEVRDDVENFRLLALSHQDLNHAYEILRPLYERLQERYRYRSHRHTLLLPRRCLLVSPGQEHIGNFFHPRWISC